MIKRVQKDLKELYQNPIENIHYHIDDNNITTIHFMIIGPTATPYEHGFFIFKLELPDKYPFKPPHVTYLSTNGYIRFHPFLYENGKVCLSLLNTWVGPQWTSIQTIRSILMSIQSIFTNTALLDEPGHQNDLPIMIQLYNKIIEYYKYEFSIYHQLQHKTYSFFVDIQKDYFIKNYKSIQSNINHLIKILPSKLPELCITNNSFIEIMYSPDSSKWNNKIIYLTNDKNKHDSNLIQQLTTFDTNIINTIYDVTINNILYKKLFVKVINYSFSAPYPFGKMVSNFQYSKLLKKLNYLKENLYI